MAPTDGAARATAQVARVLRERENGRDGEGHGLWRSSAANAGNDGLAEGFDASLARSLGDTPAVI